MVTIVGHRGAAGVAPENTVMSIKRAIDLGVDLVEFDVRKTVDDHLVVIHDSSVDRTTDGTGDIKNLSFREIRQLDAGEGEQVPSLEEMLDVIAKREVGAYIELKVNGIAKRVAAIAKQKGVLSSSQITSGDFHFFEELADSDVQIGGPVDEISSENLERASDLGYVHIGIRYEEVTPELIDQIHEYGIRVTAWPVNDRVIAEKMVANNIDALTTDRPDIICTALFEQE